jgi:DNA-binding phage protein
LVIQRQSARVCGSDGSISAPVIACTSGATDGKSSSCESVAPKGDSSLISSLLRTCGLNSAAGRKDVREAMGLTRDFVETVKTRAQRDRKFRVALLREATEALLRGETEVGQVLLRDYVNATVGFETLGDAIEKSPKSLMRMLSSSGNPQARSLFAVIAHLQKAEGVKPKLSLQRTR